MVEIGESAPRFTAPLAGTFPYEEFRLEDELGDGPIVFAFFPGAFTAGCTEEMCTFRDSLGELEALDCKVYGISVDSPAVLREFKHQHELGFDLISDFNRNVVEKYDTVLDELGGLKGLAQRSVFVLAADGTIQYKWNPGDPRQLPDVELIKQEIAAI
jgi:peroxiredoxin